MEIQLNLINQSKSESVDVVIFQKNVATKGAEQLAVAWRVISNSRPGDAHSFAFPLALELGVSDGFDDLTLRIAANAGQLFHIHEGSSGHELAYAGSATSKANIQFRNDLPREAVNVNVYRAGLLLATKTGVAPKKKASFQFKPQIWIGVVSEVVQGQVMDSAILSQENIAFSLPDATAADGRPQRTSFLSLLGLASADIVMTGGGAGPGSQPYVFNLKNMVMA
jgi:hypothetical protein